jgi:hypothetical protein
MVMDLIYYWAPLLCLGISAAYYFASPQGEPIWRRLTVSAPGALISALYFTVMFRFWGYSNRAPEYEVPFCFMLAVPLCLIVISLILFRGPKALHLLQLLNFIFLAWTWFMGSMAISGDYL